MITGRPWKRAMDVNRYNGQKFISFIRKLLSRKRTVVGYIYL